MTHKFQVTYDGDLVIFACSCGYQRIINRRTRETTVYDPEIDDHLHSGATGGLTMAPPELRQDAGPIPEDYHVDAELLARELDLGREDW